MFNITLNTFKEIIRNKFLYLILVFAFLLIVLSVALWQLTIWEGNKVIVDFWLSLIEIFWLIGVLFVGSQLVFKEIEGKTIFLILSKPIQRYEFIVWKFFGFCGVIFLIVFFQSILFLGVLLLKWIPLEPLIIFSLFFTFLKLLVLIALVLFFSTFISPILTIIITIMVYLISHSFSLLISLFETFQSQIGLYFVKILQLLFPPFEALNVKDVIGSFVSFSPAYIVWNSLYAVMYAGVILLCACIIFHKKRFEN